jgi:hypothetical protein
MKTSGIKIINLPLRTLIIGLCIASGSVLGQTLPLPRNLIAFNSAEGERLLLESKAREDYWNLSTQFAVAK